MNRPANHREAVMAALDDLMSKGIYARFLSDRDYSCVCSTDSGVIMQREGAAWAGVTEEQWSAEIDAGTRKAVFMTNHEDWFRLEAYRWDWEGEECAWDEVLERESRFDDLVPGLENEGDHNLRGSTYVYHSGDVFAEAKEVFNTYGLQLAWDGDSMHAFELSADDAEVEQ